MQVTETLSQGLKREFEVKLPMEELEERLSSELSNIKDKVRLNGFRPGKVPVAHLRRVYGRSVMADVVQNAVTEANRKIVEDHGLKLAMEPKIEFPEDKDEVTKALEAKGDLAFKIAVEVLPSFELADLSGVEVTKKVAAVSDEDLNATLERMAAANRSFTAKPEGAAAENGDRATIDFVGRVDGVEFEGGKGEAVPIVLGSGQFIPGFEEQLVGAKAGEQRLVKVTFPAAYNEPTLAGKDAEFDVTVKEVAGPDATKIDDEMAKAFGLDSLDALKDAVRTQMGRDLDLQSRRLVKKELLDALDSRYTFDLPPTLVDQEFEGIWRQVESDMKSSGKSFADEGTTEEAAKADYRKIAERRVRLGLVLAQVGETAEIKVSDEEVTQGLVERTRQFPGQERQVWEFYQKNPQALAEIRAPLFEEKVVDHLLGQVKVNEQPVDKEALFAEEGEEAKSDTAKSGETKSGEA